MDRTSNDLTQTVSIMSNTKQASEFLYGTEETGPSVLFQPSQSKKSEKRKNLLSILYILIFIILLGIGSVVYFCIVYFKYEIPYKVVSVSSDDSTISFLLNYTGGDKYYRNASSPIIEQLNFSLSWVDDSTIRIKIKDANNERWEIPEKKPYPRMEEQQINRSNSQKGGTGSWGKNNVTFKRDQSSKDKFQWSLKRANASGKTEDIIDSACGDFLFSELFIQIGFCLPSRHFGGWGERMSSFWLPSGDYSIWPLGNVYSIDNGTKGRQTYGWQPLIYFKEEALGNFDLLFLRNSNAMDAKVSAENKRIAISTVGGVLDFYFFLGDQNPETSIKNYHQKMLSGWTLLPFWSMGFTQSKWGYNTLGIIEDVINQYKSANIPLDSYHFPLIFKFHCILKEPPYIPSSVSIVGCLHSVSCGTHLGFSFGFFEQNHVGH